MRLCLWPVRLPRGPLPRPAPASPSPRPAPTEALSASTTAAGHPTPPPTPPATPITTTHGHAGPPTDGLAANAAAGDPAGDSPSTPTGDSTETGTDADADVAVNNPDAPQDTRYASLPTNAAPHPPAGDSPGTPTSHVTANATTDKPTHTPAPNPTAPPANTPSDSPPSTPSHPQPTAPATNYATGPAPSAPPRPPTTPVPIDTHLERIRSRLTRLTPEQAWDAARQGALLVDIRYAALRDRDGLIPGALVVERNELEWRLDPQGSHRLPEADRHDLEIVVLCNEGYASSLAAASLHDLGLFRATDLVGGFQAWRAAGLPVTAPAAS
ncbi:Rhodanese-related sulfurtransferase [Streptomyces sp. IgraMP-1]|nr:Rhodanese-related sulfurtransferase [Streptomyces sp. IgraMP-1]